MSGKAWFSQTIRRWFVDPAYKGEGYGWKMAAQIADRLDTAPPEVAKSGDKPLMKIILHLRK